MQHFAARSFQTETSSYKNEASFLFRVQLSQKEDIILVAQTKRMTQNCGCFPSLLQYKVKKDRDRRIKDHNA